MKFCYKVLEKDRRTHQYNPDLYDGYQRLNELYKTSSNVGEGDFSERLLLLSEDLVQEYGVAYGIERKHRLTADEVTALLHAGNLRDLESALSKYLKHKEEVWILFDNLDKGWSAQAPAGGDIAILRCLIDAARKIQRQMSRDGQAFFVIIFVRNDIYQLLMDTSADFGKETRASLEWNDPDLLREMLRRRLVRNLGEDISFEQIWSRVCISHYNGEETSQYLIDRSLMRPRNLLKLFSACRGFAVNLQHNSITKDDFEKGVESYSTDLVVDADRELSDVEPDAKHLIYQFRDERGDFSRADLEVLLEMHGISESKRARVIDFLLYYGFLGLRWGSEEVSYIFNVGYDMQMLRAQIMKHESSIRFVLNPAFWPALNIRGAN